MICEKGNAWIMKIPFLILQSYSPKCVNKYIHLDEKGQFSYETVLQINEDKLTLGI